MKHISAVRMSTVIVAVFLVAVTATARAAGKPAYPFLDATLPLEERVRDLVDRLTLEEMAVLMSVGRDIALVPDQKGPRINYFIYPYAEVDGRPFKKVTAQFSYRDLDAAGKGFAADYADKLKHRRAARLGSL